MPNNKNETSPDSVERARLRRNQRNSRARKQAYIQDLEQRWGQCVQLGAQATIEMQQAARRVQDENRLLRMVLRKQGLDDAAVEMALDVERRAGCQTSVVDKCATSAPGAEISLSACPVGNSDQAINQADSSQTVDLYNWLDDLSKIKDAFGVEAGSNIYDDFGAPELQDSSTAVTLHDIEHSGLDGAYLPVELWPTEQIDPLEPLMSAAWPLPAYHQQHQYA